MQQIIKTWETGTIDKPFFHLEFVIDSESRDRRDTLLEVLQSALAGDVVFEKKEENTKEEKPSVLGFQVEEE